MIEALYYDGRSARRHDVVVSLVDGRWVIRGVQVERDAAVDEVVVSERLGSVPRRLEFADGAFCEVADHAALDRLLRDAGLRAGIVERLQLSGRVAVAATLGVIAIGAALYVWGLPLATQLLAQASSPRVNDALSAHTLSVLDSQILSPSALPQTRRAAIGARLEALQSAAPAPAVRIEFRAGGALGANALALPDGTLVVLDELVALAAHDEEIVAVLAHELGHVHHRHGLQLLIRGTLLGAAAAWWLGDFSALIAAAPVVLLQAQHSRALETEADDYAHAALRASGIRSSRLADILERLSTAHEARRDGERRSWIDYLESHPAPESRIARLRALDASD